jgi:hypothetical protein
MVRGEKMIGDLIIMFKRLFKQNITCRHNYVFRSGRSIAPDYSICEKCGKFEPLFIK